MPSGPSQLNLELAEAGDSAPKLLAAAAVRTEEIIVALGRLRDDDLDAPSLLPGWSRLTIACHLRYGAQALARMTSDALAGSQTAYYPLGRSVQREGTLRPNSGERAQDVVGSLAEEDRRLIDIWRQLTPDEWRVEVIEPRDNPDLGTLLLSRLLVARLTEIEVHGTDLGIGLSDWSDVFVDAALPFRLGWLNVRRSNHRSVDTGLVGTWELRPQDRGSPWSVTTKPDGSVNSLPTKASRSEPRATIAGSARDLLALLLGRPTRRPLRYAGDVEFARAFNSAFPGP